jgi:hypothetical protein
MNQATESNFVRRFWLALGLVLLLKLVLAAVVPMSGDEAYFLTWGKQPDLGFYDHPPMVGWLLWLMLQLGDAEWVLRLPAVLVSLIIAYGIYRVLRDDNRDKAHLAALLYLLAPTSVLNVIITTDTGLILFSFLSAALLWRAESSGARNDYLWSGLFLGLAILSKYFSALLVLAYLVYWALSPGSPRRNRNFLWLFLAALPFLGLNLYWNYGHCWANIMFNVFNRHEGAGFEPTRPVMYLALHLYLMTPVLAWCLYQQRERVMQYARLQQGRLLALLFLVPMAVFGLLSFVKVIGLHWVLSFYPFFFMFLARALDTTAILKALRFMLFFTGAHVLAIGLFLALPIETFQRWSKYDGAVFMLYPVELLEQLAPYEDKYAFATDGYSASAIISYHARRSFAVFGPGSHYARHDDIVTDFREFDKKDVLILLKKEPEFEQYGPYFKSIAFKQIRVRGATFHLVLGQRFDYAAYREQVLRAVKDKYYAVPNYLPMGACYFCDKYFPGEACRRPAR